MKSNSNRAAAAKNSAPASDTSSDTSAETQQPEGTPNMSVAKNGPASPLTVVNLDGGQFPDLSKAKTVPFDLMSDYWAPEQTGESKRLIFDRIRIRAVKSLDSDEIVELPCAFFFEQLSDKSVRTVCNGSKRLVGVLENYEIQRGTPLLITFMGKMKNRTNTFRSDTWSVKPLVITVETNA